jgi:hypothetical protein
MALRMGLGTLFAYWVEIKVTEFLKTDPMKIFEKSKDYFPVSLDLAEMNKNPQHTQDLYTGNELVSLAAENNLTAFQAFVLLVKNTFEGYLYLMHDLHPGKGDDFSLFRADLKTGKYQDLSLQFIDNLEAYDEGLRESWNALSKEYKLVEVPQGLLLHFVLFLFLHPLIFQNSAF